MGLLEVRRGLEVGILLLGLMMMTTGVSVTRILSRVVWHKSLAVGGCPGVVAALAAAVVASSLSLGVLGR